MIPTPPFDGGAIAGAIDARLWILGVVLIGLWVAFFARGGFGIVLVLVLAFTAVPRVIALFRGQIDPRGSGLLPIQRVVTLGAYVVLVAIAVAGAAATHLERAA